MMAMSEWKAGPEDWHLVETSARRGDPFASCVYQLLFEVGNLKADRESQASSALETMAILEDLIQKQEGNARRLEAIEQPAVKAIRQHYADTFKPTSDFLQAGSFKTVDEALVNQAAEGSLVQVVNGALSKAPLCQDGFAVIAVIANWLEKRYGDFSGVRILRREIGIKEKKA